MAFLVAKKRMQENSIIARFVKGHGFSRAAIANTINGALAHEGGL